METIARHRCHGGTVGYYSHEATETRCAMRFTVFLPPQADHSPVPLVWWLSGLTCTEDNFTTKAGAYRQAAESGLAIVAPDTSPRGDDVPDDDSYDLGQGAGFYVDATQAPWATHYRMYSYIVAELPALLGERFPLDMQRQGIMGHSMGGHGALTIALHNPSRFHSVSAFAPICAPSQCPWGVKALTAYLGDDREQWAAHDATALMGAAGDRSAYPEILIDQGLGDDFLDTQLMPDRFVEACAAVGQPLRLRRHAGYDHGYFFIASYIEDHVRHHGALLNAG